MAATLTDAKKVSTATTCGARPASRWTPAGPSAPRARRRRWSAWPRPAASARSSDSPIALPRQERLGRTSRPGGRTDHTGADAAGVERSRRRGLAAAQRALGQARLPPDLAAWAWAAVARQAALKLLPDASEHYQRAAMRASRGGAEPDWPDETLAWKVRAALRADNGRGRWQQVMQAINAMSARAAARPGLGLLEGACAAVAGRRVRRTRTACARWRARCSRGIAGRLHFYGKLAAEDHRPAADAATQAGCR